MCERDWKHVVLLLSFSCSSFRIVRCNTALVIITVHLREHPSDPRVILWGLRTTTYCNWRKVIPSGRSWMKFRVGLNFEQRVGVGRNTVTGCPQWPTAPLFSAYLLQSLHSAGKRNETSCRSNPNQFSIWSSQLQCFGVFRKWIRRPRNSPYRQKENLNKYWIRVPILAD